MKTLYLECGMGAAGDMLTAALLELLSEEEQADFIRQMNSLGLAGLKAEAEKTEKCGITGTHMKITVHGSEEESIDVDESDDHEHHEHHHHHHDHEDDHEHHHHHDHEDDHDHHGHHHDHEDDHDHHELHHHHSSMADIRALISGMPVSDRVKRDALAVYEKIAEAESRVHGHPVEEIHFHEVGTMDAVADVVAVCLLMEKTGAEKIAASPVHVGSGYVRCAHGVLPVPTPATALILNGIPTYGGQIRGELCTPTGAALLSHFVQSFGDRPLMTVEKIGYGMGKKDFERANCVRAFLGESEPESHQEKITKLECNIDDMTGEDIGFAFEQLFSAGAREVYTQQVMMKKSRPGILLSVICVPEDADRIAREIMKNTTTLGIRRFDIDRYALQRRIETVETNYGPIRVKKASGMGEDRQKYEYEDLARVAREKGVSIREIREGLANTLQAQ